MKNMTKLLNFIMKYINPKELMKPIETEESIPTITTKLEISEPVYAIEKATQEIIKRWKFTFGWGSFAIEDKLTKRIFPIVVTYGLSRVYNYSIITRDRFVTQSLISYFITGVCNDLLVQSEKILKDEGIKFALSGYDKVFNEQERNYLTKCFKQLCLRKLEQATRVFEYKKHKRELNQQKQEWLSIKQGREIRFKMLEEYCDV